MVWVLCAKMAEVDEELPGGHEADDDDEDEDGGDKGNGQQGEVEEVENLNDELVHV